VPLFLTQGLTENNTVADGLAEYLRNHTGYERAWLGPWEHVRGNETDSTGRLKMGRAGFFDEVMRFYDRFLKGVAPAVQDPPIAVQTNDGKWRAEQSWPPADAKTSTSPLRPGSYTDDGSGNATSTADTDGVWTISPRLPYDAHLSGSGRAVVDVATTRPNANLVVDVYDLDEFGIGPLITRQGLLARSSGAKTLDLWSADWKIAAGHRIAVRVTDANEDWWIHAPLLDTVKVVGGSVTLPFLRRKRPATIQGDPGTQLAGYLRETITVPPETMRDSVSSSFVLPPPQT
jgi:predicted acyl esterase